MFAQKCFVNPLKVHKIVDTCIHVSKFMASCPDIALDLAPQNWGLVAGRLVGTRNAAVRSVRVTTDSESANGVDLHRNRPLIVS